MNTLRTHKDLWGESPFSSSKDLIASPLFYFFIPSPSTTNLPLSAPSVFRFAPFSLESSTGENGGQIVEAGSSDSMPPFRSGPVGLWVPEPFKGRAEYR